MKHVSRMAVAVILATAACWFAAAADGTWTNLHNGQLWSVVENWQDGIVAGGAGATVTFNALDISADTTVRLDGPRTLGNLVFGDTDINSAAGWILDNNGDIANILTLDGDAPTITVDALGAGKHVAISATIAGEKGLIKAGAGVLALSNTNQYSGATAVVGGELRLEPSADHSEIEFAPPAAGLALWLDATQGVTTNAGGMVVQWADRSGNGRHASSVLTSGPTITADINDLTTVRFTQSESQYLECGGINNISNVTIFIVNKLASIETKYISVLLAAEGQAGNQYGAAIHYQIDSGQKILFYSGGDRVNSQAALTTDTVYINEYVESNLSGRHYLNGIINGGGRRTIAPSMRLDLFRIGAWMPDAEKEFDRRFLDGSVGEIMIYTRALSEVERQSVGRYLALKWGVQSSGYRCSQDVLPAQAAVTVNEGATLAIANVDQSVTSLSGDGGSQLVLGGRLTVDGNQPSSFAGKISGTGGITVKGGGSLALSGVNSYLSSTIVEAGMLSVADKLYATGAAFDARIKVADGARLELSKWGVTPYDALGKFSTAAEDLIISNGTIRVVGTTFGERAATVAGTATLEAAAGANWHIVADGPPWIFQSGAGLLLTGEGNGAYAKGFNGSGGIRKSGSGKWTLTGTQSVNGPIQVQSGVLQVASGRLSTVPVAGAALWLDATRGVEVNASGNVTTWADLSGYGRNATSPNGPKLIGAINGVPALRFTRADSQYLNGFGLRNMTNLTIFVVHELASFPDPVDWMAILAEGSTSSNGYGCAIHYNVEKDKRINYYVGNSTPGSIYFKTMGTTGKAQIYEILDRNGACQFFMDGVADGSSTRTAHAKRLNAFRIGAYNNSRYYDGSMGEIIIYDRALNATERASVYAYLNAKWMNPSGIGDAVPGNSTLLAANATIAVDANATLGLGGQNHTCATLQGCGTVTNGAITASIHPGGINEIGTMKVSQATLSGTLVIDAAANASDCLQVTGDLDLSGLNLIFSETSQLRTCRQCLIATYTGELIAPFGIVDLPGSWEVRYTDKSVKLICHSGTLIQIR